ncbi:MAG: ELWxxDGT repeat protein [Caldilineaceae bacterium]
MNVRLPKFRKLFFLLLILLSSRSLGAPPAVQADSNVLGPAVPVEDLFDNWPSSPDHFVAVGSRVVFTADDGGSRQNVWATDGTALGTIRLKTIEGATDWSVALSILGASHGFAYFGIYDSYTGDQGAELWRTDGTVAGTQLVATIAAYGVPENFMEIEGVLYFEAGISTWKTDGTAAGTTMIDGSLPVARIPNKFFYLGQVGGVFPPFDTQLLVSDGMFNGAVVLKTFNAIDQVTVLNNRLFFRADGEQLWVSDGTPAGTQLLNANDAAALTAFQGKLYFTSNGLWHSDGTAAGTQLIKPGLSAVTMLASAQRLYLAADDGEHGVELWVSDGTAANTALVKEINPGLAPAIGGDNHAFTLFQDNLFFAANDGLHGVELWRSDGTATGTFLVSDNNPGAASSTPAKLMATPSGLFFAADDTRHGVELWHSDGSTAGTRLLADINQLAAHPSPLLLTATTERLFFVTNYPESQLWSSDGETITGVALDLGYYRELKLVGVGRDLYVIITAFDHLSLWQIDGTSLQPTLLKTFPAFTVIDGITAFQNQLLFLVNGEQAFAGLWQSDGTSAGTTRVLATATDSHSPLVTMNNRLYFLTMAGGGFAGPTTLWQSDGTTTGTNPVKTFVSGIAGVLMAAGGKLFFFTEERVDGYLRANLLWKSDGTTDGTTVVKEWQPGEIYVTNATTAFDVDGRLFFVNDGLELWTSDGTADGTLKLHDLKESKRTWQVGAGLNGKFYYIAVYPLEADSDNKAGEELWVSDGTAAGTTLFADLNPSRFSAQQSALNALAAVDGLLLFARTNPSGQRELWYSDGTAAGTQKFQSIAPSSSAQDATQPALILAGNQLYFSVNDGTTAQGLWKIAISATPIKFQPSALAIAVPGGPARVAIDYGNLSTTVQTTITLTARLADQVTYLDSSPFTPTVAGPTLTWQLPALGLLEEEMINLRVQPPAAPLGTRYPITLTMTAANTATVPFQTSATVEVMIAAQSYLPLIKR